MQVFQLIEQLMDMDPNAEVHFSYNYGDHWRTEVAPTVDRVDEGMVKFSEYHRMDKLIDEDEAYEDEGDLEGARRVVVLA
jgi:hypothetical protein